MASRLGISRKSKHIELRHLWIQDILCEGVMSLEKVGTHHNPSDVLTKFVQASVLGNHLPKLNLFKDHSLSQVFKVGSGVAKIMTAQKSHREVRGSHVNDQRLARLYHQVCAQHQGQVCMINFEAFQDHQDFMIQKFKSASGRLRRAFTPPPRGGSEEDSNHSDEDNVQLQYGTKTKQCRAFIAEGLKNRHVCHFCELQREQRSCNVTDATGACLSRRRFEFSVAPHTSSMSAMPVSRMPGNGWPNARTHLVIANASATAAPKMPLHFMTDKACRNILEGAWVLNNAKEAVCDGGLQTHGARCLWQTSFAHSWQQCSEVALKVLNRQEG